MKATHTRPRCPVRLPESTEVNDADSAGLFVVVRKMNDKMKPAMLKLLDDILQVCMGFELLDTSRNAITNDTRTTLLASSLGLCQSTCRMSLGRSRRQWRSRR